MELYGISEARSQGNARTSSNDLYNEQLKTARDNINNALDAQKITAEGNLRGQKGQDLEDKTIMDVHDALQGGSLASSLYKVYTGGTKTKPQPLPEGTTDTSSAFDSAKQSGDSTAKIVSKRNSVPDDDEDDPLGAPQTSTADVATLSQTTPEQQARINAGAVQGPARPGADTSSSSFLSGDALQARDRAEASQAEARRAGQGAPPPELGGSMPREDYGGAPTQTPGTELNNRPKTNEPVSSNTNTPDTPETTLSPTDQLSSDIQSGVSKTKETLETAKAGISKVGTGLRVLGDVGGAVSTYELFKNGLAKNKDGSFDTWKDVSQVSESIGTGLDIIGALIPGAGAGFEALGQVANAVGAVSDTIDTENKDNKETSNAQSQLDDVDTRRTQELSGLPQPKVGQAPVNTMASGGLVGTATQHVANVTQGSGAF